MQDLVRRAPSFPSTHRLHICAGRPLPGTQVLYFSSMGLVLIPYEALGAELTPDHADRSNLMAVYFVRAMHALPLGRILETCSFLRK